jgi:phospholipase C
MILARLKKSPQWPRMAVVITYDENGGFWDHMPPPSGMGWGDRWGPGTRIPTIIVSPFAKRGYVDKTPYDTTSILKLITKRFGLEPLPGVRANAGDLTGAFEFGQ